MKKFLMALCLMISSFGYGFVDCRYESNPKRKDICFEIGNYEMPEKLGYFALRTGIGANYVAPKINLNYTFNQGAEIRLAGLGVGLGTHLSTPVIAALLATLAGYKLYTHYQSKNPNIAKDTDKNKQPTSPKVAKKTK